MSLMEPGFLSSGEESNGDLQFLFPDMLENAVFDPIGVLMFTHWRSPKTPNS